MSGRKKKMPLLAAEDSLLRHLYLEFGFPSDQYARRPAEKKRFVAVWNDLADRNDTAEEVMHYIVTERKQKRWVTFGGTHKKLASMPTDFLNPAEWAALKVAYQNVLTSRNLGSDNIRFDAELGKELAKEFRALTGRKIDPGLLLATMEAKRKRGEWLKLNDRGIGFSDIGDVG